MSELDELVADICDEAVGPISAKEQIRAYIEARFGPLMRAVGAIDADMHSRAAILDTIQTLGHITDIVGHARKIQTTNATRRNDLCLSH